MSLKEREKLPERKKVSLLHPKFLFQSFQREKFRSVFEIEVSKREKKEERRRGKSDIFRLEGKSEGLNRCFGGRRRWKLQRI